MNLDTPSPNVVPSPAAVLDPSKPRCLVVADQELTVFAESAPLIEAIVADIRAARSRIWLETYIFLNDRAGTAVAEALQERARDSLDVRLLYDALGSGATPASFFRRLEYAGVQVHAFHSLWEALRSEEHTSELQSLTNLVCRLLLEKKKSHQTRTARRYGLPTARPAVLCSC